MADLYEYIVFLLILLFNISFSSGEYVLFYIYVNIGYLADNLKDKY